MATAALSSPCASSSRRRAAPPPVSFSPILGKAPPRRALTPAAVPPSAGLDTLPLPTDRARIEALVFTLIDWLDAQDAPLTDLEPDHDGEDSGDTELSEPTEALVHLYDRLGFYGHSAAQVRAGGLRSTASPRGSIG